MDLPLTFARKAFDDVSVTLQSGVIALRRGIVDPKRLDLVVKTFRNSAKFGPFVGAITHQLASRPDAGAIVDERGELTFRELDEQSNAIAHGLRSNGLGAGDVIALLARDHRGLVLSLLAVGKLGAHAVLFNTGFAKPQLADVAARENVKAVLHDSEFIDLVGAISESTPRILTWVDDHDAISDTTATIDAWINDFPPMPVTAPAKPGRLIILTSGTTGTPKGAPRDKVSPLVTAQFLDRVPLPNNGNMLMAAPIFHGTGLSQFTLGLALGNRVIFQQRRFDPERVLRTIAEYNADSLVVVPTMLQRILDVDKQILAKYRPTQMKVVFSSGSAIPSDVVTRCLDYFGDSLYNLYGSTECAVMTVATPQELRLSPTTSGRPPVGITIALLDAHRRPITETHVTGAIFVKNSFAFNAYTDGRTKEIVNAMMSSGDVGHFDDNGLLHVDGRDDDMIVSGGENVFPLEVENLIASRDDVHEVAVIGVDDPEFGKRLVAIVVPDPESVRDEEDIKGFVKNNLARYKVPRQVLFVDLLPRNPTGKLKRGDLAQIVADANRD